MPSKLTPEQIKTKRKDLIRQTWSALKEKKKNKVLGQAGSRWKRPKDPDEVPLLDVIESDQDRFPIKIVGSEESSSINIIEDLTLQKIPAVLADGEENTIEREAEPSDLVCVCRYAIGRGELCFLFKSFPPHSVPPDDLETLEPIIICNEPEAQYRARKNGNLVILHQSKNCVQRYKNLVLKSEESSPPISAKSDIPKLVVPLNGITPHPEISVTG